MHREFAEIYDVFMKHVNYDVWYKFLRMFITKRGSSGFGMRNRGVLYGDFLGTDFLS